MRVRIHCPFCNQQYDLDEFREGLEVECAACSQKFTLQAALFDGNVKADTPSANSIYIPREPVEKPHDEKPRDEKKNVAKASGVSIKSDAPDRNVLSFILAVILFAGSVIAFACGIAENNRSSDISSDKTKSYDYYGALLTHLQYKATLELLAETKKMKQEMERQTRKQTAMLYFIVSACLFAGGAIVVAIRENHSVAVWALTHGKQSGGNPKDAPKA